MGRYTLLTFLLKELTAKLQHFPYTCMRLNLSYNREKITKYSVHLYFTLKISEAPFDISKCYVLIVKSNAHIK